MARKRDISRRCKNECAYMAKQQRKNSGQNRKRSQGQDATSHDPEGAFTRGPSDSKDADKSKIGPAGRYSAAIMTREELRRIIAAYAECLDGLASFPTRCNIVERARDGMYSLHIMVGVRPRKSLRSNLLLGVIPGARHSILCEFCGSELRRASGENASTSSTRRNLDDDQSD